MMLRAHCCGCSAVYGLECALKEKNNQGETEFIFLKNCCCCSLICLPTEGPLTLLLIIPGVLSQPIIISPTCPALQPTELTSSEKKLTS